MYKFALIGHNLEYSLSPAIHSAAFDELGVSARYGLISTPKGKLNIIAGALGELDGFNITQPHKEDITVFLNENNSPIPAVNTVKCSNGKMTGYNTDIKAFAEVVNEPLSALKGEVAVVEGAGGMARAAITALKKYTDKIYIVNRSLQRGAALAAETGALYADGTEILSPAIYINCSSKELHSRGYEFPPFIKDTKINYAFDSIYFETEFTKLCRTKNIKYGSGLDMLILQALFADEIFLGRKFSDGTMLGLFETVKNKVSEVIKEGGNA